MISIKIQDSLSNLHACVCVHAFSVAWCMF